MIKNQSIKTISQPEFIDVVPQNNLISKCVIKVLYLGENRNGSFIDKEAAKKMANTLGGSPIVARYLEDKDDFSDHGRSITLEDGEIKVSCNTIPYGFVAPDAKVWFQEFVDTDRFGQQTTREYMMTTGYLWTGQYPEIQKVIEEGMPQSMELDEDTLDGQWIAKDNSGYEVFIVNDAQFSKLCILGSDVEPCFEGASVAGENTQEPVKLFTKKEDTPEFVSALLKMREQLTYALHNEGGLDIVENDEVIEEVEQPVITDFDDASDSADSGISAEGEASEDTTVEAAPAEGEDNAPTESEDNDTQDPDLDGDKDEEDSDEEPVINSDEDEGRKKLETYEVAEVSEETSKVSEEADADTDFAWKTDIHEVKTEVKVTEEEYIPAGETEGDKWVTTETEITEINRTAIDGEVDDEELVEPVEDEPIVSFEANTDEADNSLEEVEAQFAAASKELEEVKGQLETLQVQYSEALDELASLRSFKLEIENKEKDEEIAKYFMLSDADKADIIAHKSEYSLDDIKSKLAVLYVEKNVNFNTLGEAEEEAEEQSAPITTFSLDAPVDLTFNAPEWVQALINRQE